jgi:hypothetical protein
MEESASCRELSNAGKREGQREANRELARVLSVAASLVIGRYVYTMLYTLGISAKLAGVLTLCFVLLSVHTDNKQWHRVRQTE